MRKIKLNERQLLMLKSLESTPKNKVVKISESQYNRLFNKNKTTTKQNVVEDKVKKLDLSEFAEQVIVFIKDVLTNPKNVPFSPYWKQFGISKRVLYKLLKESGLLEFSEDLKEYSTPKIGFRRKIKELCKKINEKNNSLNELGSNVPVGSEFHPNNPTNLDVKAFNYNDNDEFENIINLDPSEKKFKFLYMGEDGITLFKRGDKFFMIMLSDIEIGKINPMDDEGQDGEINRFDYNDTIDNISPSGMDNWVNYMYNQGEMKVMVNDKDNYFPTLTLVTPKVKSKILKYYGNDEKIVDILNQLPETTTSGSSGAYVGRASFNEPKEGINTPEKAIGDMIEEEEVDESTSTSSVGGDSGTFAFDAPAGDGSEFWNAGSKMNKGDGKKNKDSIGTPIVRGGVYEEIKVGQVYRNGNGRIRIDSINNELVSITKWGDSPKKSLNIEPKQLSGWELFMEGKNKVLKLTKEQLKMLLESNQTDTAYPEGEMVKFDDCTKLNNNKTAENGGCSQGSVDNVVKTTKTNNSVVAEGFNPNVAAGSIYAIEVSSNGSRVILSQDNGQKIVSHIDDIYDLIKVLKSVIK